MNEQLIFKFSECVYELIYARKESQTADSVQEQLSFKRPYINKKLICILGFMLIIIYSCQKENPAKVAIETSEADIGIAVLERIVDQSLLANVTLIAYNGQVREAALRRISDQFLIAKIAVTSKDSIICNTAYEMLKDPYIMEMIKALKNSPQKNYKKILEATLPALRVLSYPEVTDKIGKIAVIKLNSTIIKEYYGIRSPYGYENSTTATGEIFSCKIEFVNHGILLNHSWKTKFPKSTSFFGFYPAPIDAGELIKPVLDGLSQSQLVAITMKEKKYRSYNVDYFELADKYKFYSISSDELFNCYFDDLTYQKLLEEIALKNESWEVRYSAVEKLWNDSILLLIATQDKDERVRNCATKMFYGKAN